VVVCGNHHRIRAQPGASHDLSGSAWHGRIVRLAVRSAGHRGSSAPFRSKPGDGIFNSGAAIEAVLTPLIVTPLAVRMGWRYPFVILGFGGLVWVATLCGVGRVYSVGSPGHCPALPGGHGLGGLHGQLLCFRSGRRPEPHGTGDRVSRRTGQPVRGRIHACCRLDLLGPFRLHAQLYHHRPAAFGRTGRSARVLAPGRHKTSLDGSLAFWHHSRSTLQTFPFQAFARCVGPVWL